MYKYFRFLLLVIGTSITLFSTAQTAIMPDGVLFQAVARDANGNAAVSRAVYAKISILKGSSTGPSAYSESFQVTSSNEGIFTLVIGKGTRIAGAANLVSIDWASSSYFINIQLAVAPTIPDPNWNPTNEYVDLGTSQFWNVPYAYVAGRSLASDSATTITTILPSTKGGTGINNNGKTITIANNIVTKGIGDLTITTTAASNVTFPASGTLATLAGAETLTNKIISSPTIIGRPVTITQDTATADSTIATTLYVSQKVGALALATGATSGAKLNLADTSAMLSSRFARDTVSLSNRINLKANKLNAKIDSSLYVNGKTTITDSLLAKANVVIDSSLFVKGNLRLGGRLLLDSGLKFNDSLIVIRGARIDSSLIVKGKIYVNDSLLAKGTISVDGDLLVKGINILSKSSSDSTLFVNRLVTDSTVLATRIGVAELKSSSDSTIFVNRLVTDSTTLATRIGVAEVKSTTDSTLFVNRLVTDSTVLAGKSRSDSTVLANRIALLGTTVAGDISDAISNSSGNLSALLTAEVNRATAAENALDARVTTNTNNINSTNASLTAEILRATTAENTETTRATNAETTLQNNINSTNASLTAEVNRATTAENVLTTSIATTNASLTAEVTRATTAETTLQNNINFTNASLTAEVTRATAAENALDVRVTTNTNNIASTNVSLTAEVVRATTAENDLQTNINANTASITANIADIALRATIASPSFTGTPTAPNPTIGDNSTQIATTAFVSAATAAATPDADATTKGKLQLTNDLGGTASAPIVNTVGGISSTTISTLPTLVASNTVSITAEITRATTVETTLQNNINTTNASLTAEVTRATTAESDLQTNINSTNASLTAEVTRATSSESDLQTNINSTNASLTAEVARATTAENDLQININANTASITANIADIALRATIASPSFTGTPTAPTPAAGDNSTQIATTAFVTTLTAAATPDASAIQKGKLQLAGDLGGTADAPIVNTVGGVSSATIATLPTLIASNTSSITAEETRATAAETLLTTNLAALATKQIVDSGSLKRLIDENASSINTNLLKQQTDSFTLANRIYADSSLLKNLINVNTADIVTNTANISTNTANISQNASDITANTLAINNRVQYTDMPAALLPYLLKNDTLSMLAVYRASMIDNEAKVAALIADTATLITRFGYKEDAVNKTFDVSADGTSDTKYPSAKAVKDFVDNAITQSTPDATTTTKGKIRLAGDLTGIAAAPTVNSVGGSSSETIHTAELLANAATDANTNDAIVKRDASGNFSAGNITASLSGNVTGNVTGNLTGNATTATTLAGARSIYGNSFDGSVDLDQVIAPNYGGTGVDNGIKTITLGGNILTASSFITTGNYSTTLNSVGVTNITLPTSGTIATLSGTETMTNKSLISPSLTGIPTAPTASLGTQNTQIATTEFVASFVTNASVADASTTVKGKLQLAGDLTGTADLPTVKTFAGVNTTTMASINTTIAAATSSSTSNTLVKRDVNGNFSAGIISAELNGNATTATTLAATKNIYGNAFDGSADLTQAIAGNYGGTGVDNGNKTITLGGNILTANSFTTAGNYSITLTSTGDTDITLPTTGTIATLAGTETLTNKTIVDATLTGVPTAPTATAGTSTNQVATTAFVTSATPDATSSVKGKIQLAGDLSGNATNPTVASVGGSAAADINTAELLANAATNNNSANTIVKRDATGNFTAGTITANLIGTSTNVTGIVAGANGGTGVANTGKTITLGRNFTTTGTTGSNASDITLKTTASTNLTLPTSGVLATLDGTENLTNKTVNGLTLSPAAVGFSIAGGTTSKTITLTDDATVSGNNTGDQTIELTGDVTGIGVGTFSTTLANSGVTAGVYGGATSVPTITIDEKGRITNAANTTITGVSSIGSLLESAKIIVGDFNNQAAKVDMTGDITIDNTGITTIGNNKVTTQTILNSNVTYEKIQNVTATNKILGRVSAGAGRVEEISTIGTGNVVRAISPTFTGTPIVPTASYPSNDGTIASTQYVTTAINNISGNQITGVIAGANGGTGVANTGKTITLGRNLTTTGTTGSNASDITFKTTGTTTLTLPTSGTLATLSDISGSSIDGNSITGVINPINGGTGVANDNNFTITLGGAITTSGNLTMAPASGTTASDATLKTTGTTVIVLPTAGVLSTLDGTETFTNKTIDASLNTLSNITNANISGIAAIDDSKLATIASSGKVENSATTATNANTANAIVARDASGNFTAGSITAALNGNASSATKLATTRAIYGNNFDGTAALTGVIASTYGGTGNGFTKFTGPATTERVFTLPNANALPS